MLADFCKLSLIVGCSALAAEQPLIVPPTMAQHVYPQRPLACRLADVALVFIGGFGDEISGIVEHMARRLPPFSARENRAYYHWNGGVTEDATKGYRVIADAVTAFRQQNPKADVVLIVHSMGAAAALKAAELLPAPAEGEGRVFLITLDPTDRVVQPVRPHSVAWWGNAYVVNSQSGHDFIAVIGGRWSHCEQADVNICFNGLRTDEFGFEFIHDNALSLFMSRLGSGKSSLFELLNYQLNNK